MHLSSIYSIDILSFSSELQNIYRRPDEAKWNLAAKHSTSDDDGLGRKHPNLNAFLSISQEERLSTYNLIHLNEQSNMITEK